MLQIVKLRFALSQAGDRRDLVSFGLMPQPFPIWPQPPLCTSLLHPRPLLLACSYGWPATARCSWSQLHCAWRTRLPPALLHSLRGSSCPLLQKALHTCVLPHQGTHHISHNCPPDYSFRAEAIFIHVTRCLVCGPFPSVGWMDSQELSRRTVRVPGSLNRVEERLPPRTSAPALLLHS